MVPGWHVMGRCQHEEIIHHCTPALLRQELFIMIGPVTMPKWFILAAQGLLPQIATEDPSLARLC